MLAFRCALMNVVDKLYDRFFREPLFPVACPRLTRITAALVIAIIVVSICSQFGRNTAWNQALSITKYEFVNGMAVWKSGLPEIRHGEVWRLFSPFLLHFFFLHTVTTSFGLWVFGTQFEWKHGAVRFLVFVLLANLVVNLTMYALVGPNFGGGSGVMLASFGYLFWRAKIQKSPGFTMPWWVALVVFAENAISGIFSRTTSLTGHVAGMVFGFFVAWLVTPDKRTRTPT